MKKIIYLLLIISMLVLFGCNNEKTTREIPNDLVQLRLFDFDEGKITGKGDERIISFEPVEVKPGLTLQRTIIITESEGAEWTINLDSSYFEGEYTHIENIPKSFAQDVSQIKFSIEPDIIIDPDPTVAWIKSISKGVKTTLKANIAWDYLMGGISGTDGKILAAVENFDDIKLFVGLEKCQFAEDEFYRMLCMIDLLGKHPDKFTLEHCKGLSDIKYSTKEMHACRAYLNKDISECQKVEETTIDLESGSKMVTNTKEEEIDSCKFFAFLTGYASCLNKDTQMQKDVCIVEQATWAEHVGGCERISNILPYQRCIAQINQDDNACVKLMNYGTMFSEDDYINCCNLLEEESYRSRCVEYVSDKKEAKEEDTSRTEFNCPTPKGAKHVVTETEDYWTLNDKMVSLHRSWYDKEKTEEYTIRCFNEQNEPDGIYKFWNKEGILTEHEYYKDGEKDGIDKLWNADGTIIYENNYKEGEKDGVQKEWYTDGTLKSEENYLNGKKNGVFKWWFEDGTLKKENNYKDNKQNGVQKWWYKDGTPFMDYYYNDHGPHGLWMEWYEDGSPHYEHNYVDGKKEGIDRVWDEKGGIYECDFKNNAASKCTYI